MTDVSSLVEKPDYNTKNSEIEGKTYWSDHNHDEYITTSEFNKLSAENFNEKLKQENLVAKTDLHTKVKRPI